MTEQTQFYTEQLIGAAKREAIADVKEMLFQKCTAIETLLKRGRNIFNQSHGERFDKLYELRINLHNKWFTYLDVIDKLDQLRNNY